MNSHCDLNSTGMPIAVLLILALTLTYSQRADAQPSKTQGGGAPSTGSLNLFEQHKAEYVETKTPTMVDIKPATYITLTGKGRPGGDEFRKKVGVLYGLAYALKMKNKFAGRDYVVCPLEALWWGSKSKHDFENEPKETWNWKLLIRTPEFITKEDIASVAGPKGSPASEVALEVLNEGKCVQVLHIGPYDKETPTIAAMRKFASDQGLSRRDAHHEIYLSDPNNTPSEQVRTLLRQPVK